MLDVDVQRYNDFIGQFDGDGTDHGWWMKPQGSMQLRSHDPKFVSLYDLNTLHNNHFRSKQAAAWAKISHGQLAPADDTDDRQLENLEDQLNDLLDDIKDSPDYEQLKDRIPYFHFIRELRTD